ncbi:MAG: adenylyltransferase/cytidyltransferase family protein [Candidatus Levyibacteriota bacterium]
MDKILSYEDIKNQVKEIKKQGKLVLVGGCFDILHTGHIYFLNEAKKQGDILLVMLEGDESIKARKGENRPVNPAKKRVDALKKLQAVDYVLLLPYLKTDPEYFSLVKTLEPDIIAVTVGDPAVSKKVEQAKEVGGSVFEIKRLHEHSTTKLINKK